MSKKFLWIFIFIALLIFYINKPSGKYPNKFDIAVIQISSAKLKSYITFLDKDFNVISTMKINCGGLSQCWDFPKIYNGKVFMNVKGTDLWLKSQIAEFDLSNGKYKLHNVRQKFNTCFTVDEKNIYAANCTRDASIVKYEIKSHTLQKLIIPDTYITHMKIFNDKLFAFGNSFIYIIETNSMAISKLIDITNCGIGEYDSIQIDNDIFFTTYSQINDNFFETDSNILCKYNLKTEQINKIKLQDICPKQILHYKNKLIISHEDWHQNGKTLSVYNLDTQQLNLFEIQNAPYQIYLYEDKIYSIDRKKIYRYNPETFELEKEFDMNTQNKFGKDFFISGFFCPK